MLGPYLPFSFIFPKLFCEVAFPICIFNFLYNLSLKILMKALSRRKTVFHALSLIRYTFPFARFKMQKQTSHSSRYKNNITGFNINPHISNVQALDKCRQKDFVAQSASRSNLAHDISIPHGVYSKLSMPFGSTVRLGFLENMPALRFEISRTDRPAGFDQYSYYRLSLLSITSPR